MGLGATCSDVVVPYELRTSAVGWPVLSMGVVGAGYAKGGRERDSTKSRLRAQNERAAMLATRFSTNSRGLSHDRAMLARGGSFTNGTATCIGLSAIFLDRRSSTGKLPAKSEWRYLSSRGVHFLSRTRPWHTHSRAHLCSCLEVLRQNRHGKDIHAQTLTSHAILVNRIDGLVDCFSK